GTILVDDQETGYVHSSVGMIYVDDIVDYAATTEYGQSYYDESTGTFHFALVYYWLDDKYHAIANGEETLQVKDAGVNARLAAAKRKAMAPKSGKSVRKISKKVLDIRVNPANIPALSNK
ncbi:MAG: hypothetical protein IKG99_13150, partial [Bacteroidaceae bacterium]|nr:hypothetical protein [Bacteroidaceae bacterium]